MKRQEMWHWMANPGWLSSQLRDAWLRAWGWWSPSPFARIYRRIAPYTMCGPARLRELYEAVRSTAAEGIAGDLVECGAARGGSAALMGLALAQLGLDRTLWVFDTFEGLPAPSAADPDWPVAQLYQGSCRGGLEEVSALFERLGILSRSRLVPGLFQRTLPVWRAGRIAVLHIDCDWYESVRCCLEFLYGFVSPGGVIQIDDYGHWQGARRAVDEFVAARAPGVELRRLDYTGRQFIKPRSA